MRTLGKRLGATALAGVLGLALALAGTASAGAATKTVLSGAGSDTIYFLMAGSPNGAAHTHGGLDDLYNKFKKKVANVTEIPPSNSVATGFPASVTVPADAGCPKTSPWHSNGSYTWDSSDAAHTPPNGSSAGITALQNDDAGAHPGCLVDFARSSRGLGAASDTPDLESYAIALDAVSWSVIGTGAHANSAAPANLSVNQLADIYTCGADGKPKASNWKQVGGKNAAIVKYAPQAGSGTLSFFQTSLLGGATVDSGCNAANLSHRAEENQLSTRCKNNDQTCASGTQPIPTADLGKLISPFSYAKWNSQKAGSEPDLRNGAVLEKVAGVKPTPQSINEGGANHFVGTRYVFTVLTQDEPTYAAAASYVGINQKTLKNGFLCQDQGDAAHVKSRRQIVAVLKAFGFTPLTDQVEGPGDPRGFCRFNPTPL
ncbi:MAG TPA: substrate-binding domain-containing protein [Acidimicrobiia bacterium]|jgi:phosphate transport system substrate-binding protein|nr:substrate-binding domain-containing protein [Acidimicrobiia bacterium]